MAHFKMLSYFFPPTISHYPIVIFLFFMLHSFKYASIDKLSQPTRLL